MPAGPRAFRRDRAPRGPLRVAILAVADGQILDSTGPAEVFSSANRFLAGNGRSAPAYAIELVAARRGLVTTSCGIALAPHRTIAEVRGRIDTLLVAGGRGIEAALGDGRLLAWLRRQAPRVRRLGSICTGSFLLAEAGLLDGRRATTHWRSCAAFARRYPRVTVDADPIFVRDGNVWTSAGVTAGMDLALSLVEGDLGREVALAVARSLVLFLRRPGGQSQFSVQLSAQAADRPPLRDLRVWIADHLAEDLGVPALASRAGMSERNFARVFAREVGMTPGRFVEASRVEAARRRLEESDDGIESIAAECGFGSAETMRRSFLRVVRVPPAAYRNRFRVAS